MRQVLTRGEPGWDIVPELYPIDGEPVIDKPGKGSFFATDLDIVLSRNGIRNLIFAGVTSDCCVHTTMTNANDKGFECLVISDASAALETRNHAMIMEITAKRHGQFGAVASTKTVLDALQTTVERQVGLPSPGPIEAALPLCARPRISRLSARPTLPSQASSKSADVRLATPSRMISDSTEAPPAVLSI